MVHRLDRANAHSPMKMLHDLLFIFLFLLYVGFLGGRISGGYDLARVYRNVVRLNTRKSRGFKISRVVLSQDFRFRATLAMFFVERALAIVRRE